ncbi:MAG TPA: DUF2007 domain-containing protein [Actinomycetota bacterium]|jgi:hypothetical protein|nr:DUF2007 domain-containing protein [Actinomycetota bacterium]
MREERAGPPVADEAVVTSLRWEEALLAAGRLHAEDIPARVHPDDLSSPYGRVLQPSVDVIVLKEDLDEARRILAELEL